MIVCFLCGDTNGPWTHTDLGFICEDCEEKIKKEKEQCIKEKQLNQKKTKRFLQEQQTKLKKSTLILNHKEGE